MRKLLFGLLVVAVVVAGCGDGDDASGDEGGGDASGDEGGGDASGDDSGGDASGDESGGASVSVVLSDPFGPAGTPGQFAVEPDPISVDAGSLEIVAKNQGGDVHDLVIVKGDDPALLPVDEYGAVIEGDLPEGDFIGEIALVDAGTEESASFDLDAGSYILFCNILAVPFSHFEDGMVNTLTVT